MMRPPLSTLPALAALLLVLPAFAQSASYEEAVQAMRDRDYELAALRFQQAIDESPPWAAGHLALAQCRFMLGRPELAAESLARALEIDPGVDPLDVHLFAGTRLYEERRYEEAIPPLAQALQRAPEAQRAPLSRRLATSFFQAGRYAEARDHFRRHQERFGFDADAAYLLALSLRHLGERASALDTMERAVEALTSEERKTRALGRLARWSVEHAWDAEDPGERAREMARALRHTTVWRDRAPGDPAALALWFDSAHSGKRIPDAIEWLEGHSDADRCLEQTLLAEAYALEGRGDAAVRQARKAVRCAEGSGRAHYALALALLAAVGAEYDTSAAAGAALERLERARESIATAVSADPAIESRARKLNLRVEAAERSLVTARDDLVRKEADDLVATETRRLQRCKSIHWNVKKNPGVVTTEDRSFYESNDCKQRVVRSVPRD